MKPLNMNQYNGNSNKLILVIAIIIMLLLGGFFILFYSVKNKFENKVGEATDQVVSVVVDNINNQQVEKTSQVLVAIKEIKNGEKLDPSMFRQETRPVSIIKGEDFKDFSQIVGLYAKDDISFRETINASRVTNKKPINTITANIPEGYRAVTINVDVTSSVEGWARAGAFVDIVWNSVLNGKPSAFVIIQNAKILSAERQVEGNPQEGQAAVPSTVTLLVLADDATKIHLAETTGKLSLQLRGDDAEKGESVRSSLTIDDLLGNNNVNKVNKKYDAIVKMKGKDGKIEKWGLKDGSLVLVDE